MLKVVIFKKQTKIFYECVNITLLILGMNPVTPMMKTQVTFSLSLYMGETQVWFYIYKNDVEKYLTIKIKVD